MLPGIQCKNLLLNALEALVHRARKICGCTGQLNLMTRGAAHLFQETFKIEETKYPVYSSVIKQLHEKKCNK